MSDTNIETVYRSKERVVREGPTPDSGTVIYNEGDVIPHTDIEELKRQGLVSAADAKKLAKEATSEDE